MTTNNNSFANDELTAARPAAARHVAGLPVAEVAIVLGRPLGTVKSQIPRSLHLSRGLFPSNPTEARK